MSSVDVQIGEPTITGRVSTEEKSLWAQFWDGAEAKAEDFKDEILYGYSKTDVSAGVDVVLSQAEKNAADVAEGVKKAKAAADRWGGFISDPERLEGVLKTVMVIVIILGVVYVIAVLSPVLIAATR